MKIAFFFITALLISALTGFAQSDSARLENGTPKVIPAEAKQRSENQPEIKKVPVTKNRSAKPQRVTTERPATRPARSVRPVTRPVRPGSGRN
jgi:hypothetical protein